MNTLRMADIVHITVRRCKGCGMMRSDSKRGTPCPCGRIGTTKEVVESA